MFLVKDTNLDYFRVKSAKALFDRYIVGLISLKESEFKQSLQSILKQTCPARQRIGEEQLRIAFKGWVLLSEPASEEEE
jgi:hypothetical protein